MLLTPRFTPVTGPRPPRALFIRLGACLPVRHGQALTATHARIDTFAILRHCHLCLVHLECFQRNCSPRLFVFVALGVNFLVTPHEEFAFWYCNYFHPVLTLG